MKPLDLVINRAVFYVLSVKCKQKIGQYEYNIYFCLGNRKKGLDEITNTLFEKFGMNAGLCAVAISYYLGVGNDALKAYELGKRSVEEYPNSVTYSFYMQILFISWLRKARSRNNSQNIIFGQVRETSSREISNRDMP